MFANLTNLLPLYSVFLPGVRHHQTIEEVSPERLLQHGRDPQREEVGRLTVFHGPPGHVDLQFASLLLSCEADWFGERFFVRQLIHYLEESEGIFDHAGIYC